MVFTRFPRMVNGRVEAERELHLSSQKRHGNFFDSTDMQHQGRHGRFVSHAQPYVSQITCIPTVWSKWILCRCGML